jgi:hypothetical protein
MCKRFGEKILTAIYILKRSMKSINKVLFILSGLLIYSGACLDAQVLRNAGNMHVGGTGTSLYIAGSMRMTGSGQIANEGKTVLIGNLINDVTANAMFTPNSAGTFEFRGSTAQTITGTANKKASYIDFPNTVIINNQSADAANTTVTVAHDKGIQIKNLTFTRGRLVLASNSSVLDTKRIADVAHLYAENGGNIVYRHGETNAVNEGVIQVNLSLGDNWEHGRIVGFSSPFKTLYADYFLFNFLGKPDTTDRLSRSGDVWIKDPKTELPAGRGYFLGQGLVPLTNTAYYLQMLNPAYSTAQLSAVAKNFVFARKFAPASLTSFVNAAYGAAAYSGEELNSSDVSVTITPGYNFLGNPFLAPIRVNDLFDTPIPSEWGITSGIDPYVWVLSSGTGEYLPDKTFSFGINYLVAQSTGATTIDTIAPMQMFVINKDTPGTAPFTIPQAKRTYGSTHFLRSETPTPVVDELLIETLEKQTGNFDRLCIVFRRDATLAATDMYDAPKLFNRTGGVNQAYTRSSDNKSLTTNVIPPSTDKIVMYFEPSLKSQVVTLKASRLNSITSVPNVVLEDRVTGKAIDLKRVPNYDFQSSSSDRADRFVLHFGSNAPVGVDDIRLSTFNVSYESGGIEVYGIEDRWMGRAVFVYDMLGQLVANSSVTQAPFMRIEKNLSKGIYLFKIAGENTLASRFLVK